MHIHTNTLKVLIILGALFLIFAFASSIRADHSWADYHWARTANPFTLALGDSVSIAWDPYLKTTASDWSTSTVLDVVVTASGKNPKTCKPTLGRGEVCNAKYGANGWLGIASIWAVGGHITQGTVKLNDTYFSTRSYNTPAWKNLVMCQEVGHIFGLDHKDETFTNANLGTCMDYTNSPTSNQHPNAHDYGMLEVIYAHLDTTTSVSTPASGSSPSDIDTTNPREWGRLIRESADRRSSLYERDLGNGEKLITHVFWTEDRERPERPVR